MPTLPRRSLFARALPAEAAAEATSLDSTRADLGNNVGLVGSNKMAMTHPVGVHDMGGTLPAGTDPAVGHDEHEPALWEQRVDAMLQLLRSRGLIGLDEMRRHVEGLGDSAYRQLEYYERWVAAMGNALLEAGVISSEELGARMAAIEARLVAER